MRFLPLGVPCGGSGRAADPASATPGPNEPATPHASAASPDTSSPRPGRPLLPPPRGARPRCRLRSKWRWRRRAAGYETRGRHMAAPAPNLAGSAASRRPGEAGLRRKEAARRPLLTHGPVAQDRDLSGLGLRHLGGLLRPGPTTSTTAAAAPVLRSAAAAPGQSGIQGRGGAGGRGRARLPRLQARAPNRPEPPSGPAPKHAHVTARRRRLWDPRDPRQRPRPNHGGRLRPRNAQGCVGRRFTLKGKRGDAEIPPEMSRLKLAAS